MSDLAISGLGFAYGAVTALDGVDLLAPAGEITCVIGRNGVGKTTLMRTVMGSQRAARGSVRLGGTDLSAAPAPAWRWCRRDARSSPA